jgi:hypothetical protein
MLLPQSVRLQAMGNLHQTMLNEFDGINSTLNDDEWMRITPKQI